MRRRLLITRSSSDSPLFLETFNRGPQPVFDRFFDLLLIAMTVEGVECLMGCIERNVPAGNLFRAAIGWHKVHENTITAWTGTLSGIVVHAGKGVFENVLRSPGCLGRTPIASLLEKFEFKFQNLEEVALILLHRPSPIKPEIYAWPSAATVTIVTRSSDGNHS